jgi:hypothetical protein
MTPRWLGVAGVVLLATCAMPDRAADSSHECVGESIYLDGVLGSGAPLEGTRGAGGVGTQGKDAACVNCHQRSGLGSKEGSISIPPVTGDYLSHSHDHGAGDSILPYVEGMHGNRDPYSDSTLARAIREGLARRAQLDRHLTDDPVYAILSGLGGPDWAPVHEFCEQNEVPCLFPNVEVPVDSERGFYSLYFSRGVLLEAQLIANEILNPRGREPAHVVRQIYRAGDSGEPAAQALAAELKDQGVTVRNHALAAGAQGRGLSEALRGVANGEILVLWLRSADIAALGTTPPGAATVYMSGLMGGLENSPLPSSWREHTFLAYPFDIPDKRGVRLDYPLGWFSFRHIPVVAEQVQVDTYLACSLLAEVLNHHMADNFVRPYLIEQLQNGLEHRIMTGYYPHLTLASHQRFASKGGYIARFTDPRGPHLMADGDWIVP